MSGPSQGSPVGDWLWKENVHSCDPGALGDEPCRLEQLVAVRIALVEDPGRQRVRREDDVCLPVRLEPLREQLDESRLVPPALDETKVGAAVERVDELLPVLPDRHGRVVRRKHEPDDRLAPAVERGLDRLGDARRPVAHAGEDGQAELGFERGARRLGDLVERVRLLDPEPAVTRDEIVEVLRA